LLLGFTEQRTGKPPSALQLADLDAPLVLDFLDHLQADRGNTARTRNARLAATRRRCRSPSGCWPSRPSGSTGPCSATSPATRSPRSWPPPTAAPGAGT